MSPELGRAVIVGADGISSVSRQQAGKHCEVLLVLGAFVSLLKVSEG
jgi:2-polyprenyl-6-methoxyphenol hydroxylase-like FAD-dependent oxidoreductase